MKRKQWILCAALLIALGLLAGCANQPAATGQTASSGPEAVVKAETAPIQQHGLVDDPTLYDDDTGVTCFYVTVRQGTRADNTAHTFAEVNSYRNVQGALNVQKIYASALVQVGDENGPAQGELGYGQARANATINVRGRTSTDYVQKSYRLNLLDNAGFWNGQRAIALNKHPADPTRLRNAVYFRLLQDVPGMTSLRTEFVHLYVRDETDPTANGSFVDYGLFTQVELPNGRYLRNHGLSIDGNLYKANLCELYRYPEQLKLVTDPAYDLATFCEVLEPKTTNDHSKLLEMLDAVNDYSVPIEQTVARYFDLENLTSYVAYNLLMANPDSNAQNYLLYSPVNSSTWYYLCWDGDGSLSYYEDELLNYTFQEGEASRGIGNYWSVVLFNRMFRVDAYRDALTAKVEQLRGIVTPARIAELVTKYRKVVDGFTTAMPDQVNMQVSTAQLELIYEHMPEDVDTAYAAYYDSLEHPMPFYLGDVRAENGMLLLEWNTAYDFDNELVHYTVQVATDWDFAEDTLVASATDQMLAEASFPLPAAGEYFWRVIATNESGYTQVAFDQVVTATGSHVGLRQLTVTADGTVVN